MCVLVNGAVSVNVQLISAGPHQCRIESSERLHQPCVVAGFVVILVDHAIELCFGLASARHCTRSVAIQTWLILPVVICLSQRLSHACLSISFYTAKLRMAH